MEIERKFRLTQLPDLPVKSHKVMYQGYLYTYPYVVRIRKGENLITGEKNFILCIKSGGQLARHEIETALTENQFDELQSLLSKPLIKKDFYTYSLDGGYTLECSIVDDGVFSYAEVEFETEKAAMDWTPPEYLGQELTFKKGFSMSTYWENGEVPKIDK